MKKFLPLVIGVLGFTGFLATQILWDISKLNAQQITAERSKDSLFERLFHELRLETDQGQVELKTIKSPVVVLNFWASWCLPCLKEFPSLMEFRKKYGDKVGVVGINGDDENPKEKMQKTSRKYGLDFPQVLDPQSKISDRFQVQTLPYSVVYHRGKVLHLAEKAHDFMDAEFIAKVDAALKEP